MHVTLRANSHMRLRACGHCTSSTLIGGKGELVHIRFTLCLRYHRSMWMHDGCKVYMDSYMASNGSCFMVTWTTFKDHLLEVGLTLQRMNMASPLRMYANALNNTPSYSHVNSYVVWRVHSQGIFHVCHFTIQENYTQESHNKCCI